LSSKNMGTTLGIEAADSAFGTSSTIIVDRAVDDADVAKTLALARLETLALKYISGEWVCHGNPALVAGAVVEISGVGTKFSGKYYVSSATHTMNMEQGYRTKLNVRRNATS